MLEEQLEEKCRVMTKIEEGYAQINMINEQITITVDDIQRAKFWLYVANNELEKEKLRYKLQIHQLKKRNQKLVQEYCGATLDNVIVKNVRSSRSIETRAQPKVQLELEKPTTLYDNMQFDDKISPVIVLH